jgi:membrane-bound lytic murein transglycosylase A
LVLGLCLGLGGCASNFGLGLQEDDRAVQGGDLNLKPISYSNLTGWSGDDHAAAFRAFRRSCGKIDRQASAANSKKSRLDPALVDACRRALALGPKVSRAEARAFFEQAFTPHEITASRPNGLLTSYFEPVLEGARKPGNGYNVPIYRRPTDLMLLSPSNERGTRNAQMTAMRKTANGSEPYPTRQQIEQGALKGRGLELLYLKDPVDAYIMHIQGSARIRLPNGHKVRIGFAAKNGYPYTSIGKALIDQGEIDASKMSMQRMKAWMRANPEKAKRVMWMNKSFIFFRELDEGVGTDGPIGAQGVSLSAGRSLAVDTGFHTLGAPIWVKVPGLKTSGKSYARLMIAQDVGSAIQGPERGDIYWGSGEKAGRAAGKIKYPGSFVVLVPNTRAYR